MSRIIVLGAGMVGSAMAIDMTRNHDVTLADLDKHILNAAKKRCAHLNPIQLDVTKEEELHKALAPFELVICAVPGFLGFNTLRSIINSKKNVVDISFFPEDPFELDELAKEKNVTAIVDCGVAPGMDNIMLGYYNERLLLTDFECLVGGLPKKRKWPFDYKAPFSPMDVIEEYTRPARFVENGKLVIKEALSDCELISFDKVGTLESFNSDGLRSIIKTMPHISNLKEKTLRYPGHAEYIKVLKSSGFFDIKTIKIKNTEITPLEFTSKILFKEWKLEETEEEITVMRISLKGKNDKGEVEVVTINLYDEFCNKTKTSSMARTTGYTATAVSSLLLDGLFDKKGIIPPELIGKHEKCYHYILKYLGERNINYVIT